MSRSLEAARDINAMWIDCLPASVELAECPSDEQVATVINKHFTETAEENS